MKNTNNLFSNLKGDAFGGITAGIVALPLALAFGVSSGLGPSAGLYGAIFISFFAAIFGISILEAQNYFAHYGLRRKVLANGRYERVNARHSWNSDHIIGRVLLFELTRHSDHHHIGGKPYQILESKDESPMLPYGYPMMLMLSFFPFLFRPIMKRQLDLYNIE